MTLRFRHWWPPLVMVTFLIAVASVFAALPSGLSGWWGILVFLLVALPFGGIANVWGPMLFYRLRVRRRPRWAQPNGFVPLAREHHQDWVAEVFTLFRRPEKGLVLAVFRGHRAGVVDYSYLRRYAGERPQDGGVQARDAATVVVVELGRAHPHLDVEPRPFGFGMIKAALDRRLASAGLPALMPDAVETGDRAFDETFLVRAVDARSARLLLNDRLRQRLMRHAGVRVHLRGAHAFFHLNELLANREVARLLTLAVELATEIDTALPETSVHTDQGPHR